MNRAASVGRRLIRDCFLCLGGAFVLIALGSLTGNLPDALKYGDWPAADPRQMLVPAYAYWTAAWGAIFLVTAYSLFRWRRWATAFAAAGSAAALVRLATGLASERSDPQSSTVLLVFSAPMLLALTWALGATLGEFAVIKEL